jgi:hypothetical protein
MREELWAITCYFNPAGYRRRFVNYRIFRDRLNVPLIAVELGYDKRYDLHENDAEVVVRLPGKDILWQKERLLNVALRSLPNRCRKVVWLDCDVVFEAADWAKRTSLLLDRFALVQPFAYVHRAHADWHPGGGSPRGSEVRRSIPSIVASGMPIASCLAVSSAEAKSSPGYAWAANRELLEQHQLYDACIIGGGDSAILCAAYGCFADAVRIHSMNARQQAHYFNWGKKFYETLHANVTFAHGEIVHLWHGNKEDRQYRERYEVLTRFQFDPFRDIALDEHGAWRWNTGKVEMHDNVRAYFASRREDG